MDRSSILLAGTGKPTGTGLDEAGFSLDGMSVAVIIPTFNYARFLPEAIMSVLAQTRQADEIIVVDDGSTDDPASIVAQFQTVRLLRQENRGPSAARNKGLRNCKTSHIVFFDADDRLLPAALESGLNCIAGCPDCAFVYGGHRRISVDGHPLGPDVVRPIKGDAHLAFLRLNLAGPPMTVLFRRDCLLAVNGFDETLRHCEDYDVYLRLAQRYPIASHPTLVAEHRMHGQAASNDYVKMLKGGLLVLDLNKARIATDPIGRAAIQEGRTNIRSYYVPRMIDAASASWRARHDIGILARDLIQAARWSPYLTTRALLGFLGRRASKVLPHLIVQWIQRIWSRP
jgi:glycosyltransferase involved in cell wall biosynthesis